MTTTTMMMHVDSCIRTPDIRGTDDYQKKEFFNKELNRMRNRVSKLGVPCTRKLYKDKYFEYIVLNSLSSLKKVNYEKLQTFDSKFMYWLNRKLNVQLMQWLETYIPMFLQDSQYQLHFMDVIDSGDDDDHDVKMTEADAADYIREAIVYLIVHLHKKVVSVLDYSNLMGNIDDQIICKADVFTMIHENADDVFYEPVEGVIEEHLSGEMFDVETLKKLVSVNLYDCIDNILTDIIILAKR